MKRKTIAVCVCGYNWEFESRIVEGIRKACARDGIDLLLFNPLLHRPDAIFNTTYPRTILNGEEEIFSLLDMTDLDGLIIEPDSFIEPEAAQAICDKAGARGIPVVNAADSVHLQQYNVLLSDTAAMEPVVDHLIEVHGLKKMAFIGGFVDNMQTLDRLDAFKRSLARHGLEFDPELVEYGGFWKAAYECTGRLMEKCPDLEAIICANDTMACFAIDCLSDMGKKVPDDIIVTGFDGTAEGQNFIPSLTTTKYAFAQAGETCVELLKKVWAGEEIPATTEVMSEMLLGQSCGCLPPRDNIDTFNEFLDFRAKTLEFNNYLIEMNTAFASARNSAELYSACLRGAEYFGMKELTICICDSVDNEVGKVDMDSLDNVYNGLTENMKVMYDMHSRFPIGKTFKTCGLRPQGLGSGGPLFLTFTPLYFKNTFLGYIVYERDRVEINGDLYTNWVMAISNNAGSYYMRNQLAFVVKKLEELYVRDPMTNLYNRRGLLRFGKELIDRAVSKGKPITVFSIDIDNLKPINDNYGHLGGDNAICQAARAIQDSLPLGSVCARTGGDEFCAICAGLAEGTEGEFTRRMDELLARYNETGGMPYSIGVSSGSHTVEASGFISLDEEMKLADIEMYKVKMAKKTIRR